MTFADAFQTCPGHKDNFVKLADLRKALPLSRAEFDAQLRSERIARRYTLDKSEGNRVVLTQEEKDAGIIENGERLVYISRM